MALEHITYLNHKSIKLSFNNYSVTILYGRGCNIIDFSDTSSGSSFLHFPEENELDEFAYSPQRFGSAILFPPNKIQDGNFTKDNITYDYLSNNLPFAHGIIKELPFSLEEAKSTPDSEYVRFKLNSKDSSYYPAFNWDFDCIFEYTLSEKGLIQNVTFINNGTVKIPFGVGYHTAFRIPFAPESTSYDYKILVTSDFRFELDESNCPTGQKTIPSQDYMNGNAKPLSASLAEHLHSIPDKNNFHGAIVTNTKTGTRIIYETDPKFKYWMIWNNRASDNYVCIEPMSWIINAPKTNLPDSETGFSYLNPNEVWSAKNKLWID